MTYNDVNQFKNKFEVGDIVLIPASLAELTHFSEPGSQIAEVVGLYRHVFNVKYPNLPYEQSIQYKDAGKVNLFLDKTA